MKKNSLTKSQLSLFSSLMVQRSIALTLLRNERPFFVMPSPYLCALPIVLHDAVRE